MPVRIRPSRFKKTWGDKPTVAEGNIVRRWIVAPLLEDASSSGHPKKKENKMEFTSWDKTRRIPLLPCPFCSGEPKVRHIGNDYTKKRSVEISCTKCRVKRTDAALTHSFSWLEEVAARHWNTQASRKETKCREKKTIVTDVK